MSSWAIVAIVAISVWGFIQLVQMKHGGRHWHDKRDEAPPQIDTEAKRELEELRERVKVLEQITVDGREAKAIADEIEKLRDR